MKGGSWSRGSWFAKTSLRAATVSLEGRRTRSWSRIQDASDKFLWRISVWMSPTIPFACMFCVKRTKNINVKVAKKITRYSFFHTNSDFFGIILLLLY